jgi:hypothetical protein
LVIEIKQTQLFDMFKKLHQKKCTVMKSNSDTQFVKDLYQKYTIDFTAINLGGNLFLAQVVTGTHKKGVFFKIENGKIKVTAARYCLEIKC